MNMTNTIQISNSTITSSRYIYYSNEQQTLQEINHI
jgi:hypothetical protein